jgi:hypothetical protein
MHYLIELAPVIGWTLNLLSAAIGLAKNRRPATRHDVGKTVKREETKKETRRQAA